MLEIAPARLRPRGLFHARESAMIARISPTLIFWLITAMRLIAPLPAPPTTARSLPDFRADNKCFTQMRGGIAETRRRNGRNCLSIPRKLARLGQAGERLWRRSSPLLLHSPSPRLRGPPRLCVSPAAPQHRSPWKEGPAPPRHSPEPSRFFGESISVYFRLPDFPELAAA